MPVGREETYQLMFKELQITICFENHKDEYIVQENLRKATVLYVVYVSPQGIWFPLDGFSWNLTSEYLSKIRGENRSFIKVWQE